MEQLAPVDVGISATPAKSGRKGLWWTISRDCLPSSFRDAALTAASHLCCDPSILWALSQISYQIFLLAVHAFRDHLFKRYSFMCQGLQRKGFQGLSLSGPQDGKSVFYPLLTLHNTPLWTHSSEEPWRATVFVGSVERICQERRLSVCRSGVLVSTIGLWSFLPCFLSSLADLICIFWESSLWRFPPLCMYDCADVNACTRAFFFCFSSAFVFHPFRLHCCCNVLY